jgi:SAM-dependent methyltransferase
VKRCVRCAQSFESPEWVCPKCGFAAQAVGPITRFTTPTGKDGFDPDAFDRLVELEHQSFWFRARNRLIGWAVDHYFPDAASLLEIGCGTGFVLESLRRHHPDLSLLGGDLHIEGLAHAAARVPDVSLLQFDARRIPFDTEFDVVCAFDVLEHIDEDERAFAEMRRAIRPGGGMMLTVPQHRWLWSATDECAEHKRRYRRGELVSKVSAAGFTVRRVTSFVTLLLPAMAMMRLRGRLGRVPVDPAREHLTAQRLTAPLECVLAMERLLIAHGADLPVGGSLLLVARRGA